MPEPLRLYRWADAPPDLQALSDAGGEEVLVAVVPPEWLDEGWTDRLPYTLWLLLVAPAEAGRFEMQLAWGRVQRVVQASGSVVAIVSRA